ncbi:uncharacterized protein GGS22DRAFT_24247 [Annulohypoxylon maeteangense]|uniref:uncharacterized protein n=1 Tax=Annulohypoxylon maeteangense TaxID=1927788 RepID=UPI002007F1B7|nr:uncharacterized protein GGS22DRAFT_24247 [Annulohypoxylon maeteangense]KAI0883668.1 hypothetical protein GGS22DRAFT_24247 [Annulohypoxylon maeteangense]
MLPPRTVLRRLVILRPSKPSSITCSTTRLFTKNTNLAYGGRPQLPFLSVPLTRNQQFRYLTTERKRWLVSEVCRGLQYTVILWFVGGSFILVYWAVQQDWLETKYPTPDEWGFRTRLRFRLARWVPDQIDSAETDWVTIGNYINNVLERLEDETIDGNGLKPVVDNTEGESQAATAYDITAKSEPWRRGYYEALMLCAKAAENLDDQVVDKSRHLVFPADQIIGPSNPNPKPIRHGSPSAPIEQDCESAFEKPSVLYQKILATKGFTFKQKMDAALEYASFLDFRGSSELASAMYDKALALATENSPRPYDIKAYVLQDVTHHPSANLLNTLTALATHKARNGDITTALPILISILRARRSLPHPQPNRKPATEQTKTSIWSIWNVVGLVRRFIYTPVYPPPPPDGSAPPVRDAKELCEEAGLNLYIGEIIYASSSKAGSREDGLAWTREAIDLAEEQLHRLNNSDDIDANESDDDGAKADAKKTCKECLGSGLDNWRTMVATLAREERDREAQEPAKTGSGWLAGLWGEGTVDQVMRGRWAAEENVVKERTKRAMEVLEDIEAPKAGFLSLFTA